MTGTILVMLLVVAIVVPMVSLTWVTLQPSRQSVWSSAVCLALLPAMVLVLVMIGWVMGR
jgi:hypothetical protein